MRVLPNVRTGLRTALLLALFGGLAGCSAMQAIGVASKAAGAFTGADQGGLYANAQVGAGNVVEGRSVVDARRVEDRRLEQRLEAGVEVDARDGVSNVQSSSEVNSTEDKKVQTGFLGSSPVTSDSITFEKIPDYYWLILVLIWLMPGAVEMGRWIGGIIKYISHWVPFLNREKKT